MKVETAVRDIQRSDSFEERAMGLAVGSESFVFNVLRKDLYSDPIGSLIREYTVNAQDEHRKHNKSNTPIHIQVPNQFAPELHIRDYAGGLTEEQVFNFFGNYGASDKRDSNVAVGFFGLGCKSAFAYTDSYIVKSYKDGIEYTFNVYIDETEIGRVAKITACETTEPNGVKVIVPVKSRDIYEFQRKVISTVRYFKTKPVLTGMAEQPVWDDKTSVIKGDGWEFFGNGSPKVIMGEIAYPLDYYAIENLEDWESSLLRSELLLYVNIGDVQVTASREALQMSPKTITAIRAKLATIKDVMVAETQKAISEAKTLLEAKTLYSSVALSGGGYSNIIKNSGKALVWNGKTIDDNVIRFEATDSHFVSSYSLNWRGSRMSSYTEKRLICKAGDVFYFDDTSKTKIGYSRRARTLFNAGAKNVYFLHTSDVAGLEKILGMKVTELPSLDAVVPTVLQSNRVGGTGVDLTKRVKHTAKAFVLDVAKLKSGVSGSASEFWKVQDVEKMDGLYISIERFKPVDMTRVYDLFSLRAMVVALESNGIKIDKPIYGIKKGGSVEGLTKFEDWAKKTVSENKTLIDRYSKVRAFRSYNYCDVSGLNLRALPDSVAKEYAVKYEELKKLYYSEKNCSEVFQYVQTEVEPDKSVHNLSKEYEKKYPMLTLLNSYNLNNQKVVDYITERESMKP